MQRVVEHPEKSQQLQQTEALQRQLQDREAAQQLQCSSTFGLNDSAEIVMLHLSCIAGEHFL